MTAARRNHSPVSLPPGSYDREQLGKGLDKAAAADPDNRAAAVTEAVKAATGEEGQGMSTPDGSMRPDMQLIEREHEELGITERVRVHDPDSKGAEVAAQEAERADDLQARQSETLARRAASEPDVDPVDVHVGDPPPGGTESTAGDGAGAGEGSARTRRGGGDK